MIDSIKLSTREFGLSSNHRLQWDIRVGSGGEVVRESSKKRVILEGGWCASVDENRGGKILYLDGSVPKLLYGSSLDECKVDDYDRTVAKLKVCLDRSGIQLPAKSFESDLKLSRVDWCRNVSVSQPIPSYLDALSKFDMPRMDKAVWNSETVLWKNTRHQFTMYDKVAAILDKEDNTQILERARSMAHDRLRVEYRELRTVGVGKMLGKSAVLADVFDDRLSKTVLMSKLETLVRRDATEPIVGYVDLAAMLHNAGGKPGVLRGLIGSHGIMAQCGNDADQLMSFFLSCGVAKRTAYWYKAKILDDCAECIQLDSAMLIAEVRQLLAA